MTRQQQLFVRYLGLLTGLVGLWWLVNQPMGRPNQGESPIADSTRLIAAMWKGENSRDARALVSQVNLNAPLGPPETYPLLVFLDGEACNNDRVAASSFGLLESLLAQGADPNVQDAYGNSPLMLAAMRCPPTYVQMLLDAGANTHARNARGLTAFEVALNPPRPTLAPLVDSGFALDTAKYCYYQRLFWDEPHIQKWLDRANSAAPQCRNIEPLE